MDSPQCSIILFTRIPVPGKIKTRLHPILSPEECAFLQEAMALDLAEKLSELGLPIVLSYSDEWSSEEEGEALRDSFLAKVEEVCVNAPSFVAIPQRGGDLGARMDHAMQDAFDSGAEACILMGSDLPDIMRHDVEVAQRALAYSDVVLGPTDDGGYWLVGVRSPFPELFEGKDYGSGGVLTDAVATCRAHERTVALSRETFDIDAPEDYYQLCKQVNKGDFRLGKRTVAAVGQLMAVSAADSEAYPSGEAYNGA